jgi:hypothetical protein
MCLAAFIVSQEAFLLQVAFFLPKLFQTKILFTLSNILQSVFEPMRKRFFGKLLILGENFLQQKL